MRKRIIQEAKTWMNTPFHLHGRLKNVGCDCVGLVLGVAQILNLRSKQNHVLPHFDTLDYHPRESNKLLEQMLKLHLVEKTNLQIADVVMLKYDSIPGHIGIVSQNQEGLLSIVHANMRFKKVVEHTLDESLRSKIVGIFSFIECEE